MELCPDVKYVAEIALQKTLHSSQRSAASAADLLTGVTALVLGSGVAIRNVRQLRMIPNLPVMLI